jgi:hypothetical protein
MEERAARSSWQVGGNAGPSRTGISWRERGSASDQLRTEKEEREKNSERCLVLRFRCAALRMTRVRVHNVSGRHDRKTECGNEGKTWDLISRPLRVQFSRHDSRRTFAIGIT